jgi:hypothetical protein
MNLNITAKIKLCRPPTSISQCFGRIYVSTKGKRVFFTNDMRSFKSIVFGHQVNSLTSSEETLYCSQQNGQVFGLNEKHKSVFKVSIGESECVYSLFNNQLYVGSTSKKVTVFGIDSLLKNAYFINETPLIYFDISENNVLSAVSQNEPLVQFVDLKTKEKQRLKIVDGFPEIIKYLKNDVLIIGTTTGMLNCFSTVNFKRISYLKFNSQITSIYVISSTLILVGVPSFIYLVDFSKFNKMEISSELKIDGIPIDFCGKDKIYCAISRESRLGRWKKCKTAHNQVIEMEISD